MAIANALQKNTQNTETMESQVIILNGMYYKCKLHVEAAAEDSKLDTLFHVYFF